MKTVLLIISAAFLGAAGFSARAEGDADDGATQGWPEPGLCPLTAKDPNRHPGDMKPECSCSDDDDWACRMKGYSARCCVERPQYGSEREWGCRKYCAEICFNRNPGRGDPIPD